MNPYYNISNYFRTINQTLLNRNIYNYKNKYECYSYSLFMKNNHNAKCKEERILAINRFLNSTRK